MTQLSLSKDKIRILLLEGLHPSSSQTFTKAGYNNIECISTSISQADLLEKIKGVHFIGIRSQTNLNKRILDAANKLIGIGCYCIGTNQVDLITAQKKGIVVFNAPFSNTRSVAELVLGQTLLLLRGVPERNAKTHRGEWDKSATNSFEARGKNLGIIGYGHIGTQLGILAENLGFNVSFYDIENKLTLGNATQVATLSELLAQSDIISLHVPALDSTKDMIAANEFSMMKNNAILINAARGNVVDIPALCEALESKKLLGAAIDVFPKEPKSNDNSFTSALCKFDNVILTPHIGGSTQEAQQNIGNEVSGKLVKYSDNGSTLSAINFPEVSLPVHKNTSRLLHLHENHAGILTKINLTFADHNINISGQYLQTNENIGYVVIDVDSENAQSALERLRQIEGTIRARLLN
ncbi:MAG: phosphoglycerate dehydrogenase [Psychromonas sp.]|nr:phosphoglycerate dehydrogenase [Psychromonas sp.]